MRTRLAALVLAAGLGTAVSAPAHAQQAAWCGYEGGRNSYENCSYPTLSACTYWARGVGGNCRPNPRAGNPPGYGGYDDPPPPPRRRSRRYD